MSKITKSHFSLLLLVLVVAAAFLTLFNNHIVLIECTETTETLSHSSSPSLEEPPSSESPSPPLKKKNFNDHPSFEFEPHPFRYVFPDFMACDSNITSIRTFLVVLTGKTKDKQEKRQLIEKQKSKFSTILVENIEELRQQPHRVKEHEAQFTKLVDFIFNVDLTPAKVCQYVYDTVFEYDMKKLGKTVVHSKEEYERVVKEKQREREEKEKKKEGVKFPNKEKNEL
ncbi:hypothetical protein FDP41_010506 [Naegleria fowleri]|uniref:Uncharacterized protein n=1 Tax=Naegleria fowleri TaxID=5763 RepID=A0A6A5C8H5_NAEFO|nr:uncharacterized protein FDP41_010506 [Naegleria fowleri]KAF0983441.1 hypothetical protein FDP41_010506 [Naegleria fowleri]CAG4713229.1 unnamed protein product [Naegleria fowleri]